MVVSIPRKVNLVSDGKIKKHSNYPVDLVEKDAENLGDLQ
jgi:hypothetical protein